MVTARDLAEAHAHGRRRLGAALVSGAPGPHPVEPDRPTRAMVGGLVLALVLLGAGAATRLLDAEDRPQEGRSSGRSSGWSPSERPSARSNDIRSIRVSSASSNSWAERSSDSERRNEWTSG